MNDDYDSMIEYGKTMKNMFCFKTDQRKKPHLAAHGTAIRR
jgi:hypothetical protein